VADILGFLNDKMDQIRADVLNFHLTVVAPAVGQQCPEYEGRKFQERLEAGSITVDATRRWVKGTIQRLAASPAATAGNNAGTSIAAGIVAGDPRSCMAALREGLVHLLSHAQPLEAQIQAQQAARAAATGAASSTTATASAVEDALTLPEVLWLDAGRLTQLQDYLQQIVLTATLSALVQQLVAPVAKAWVAGGVGVVSRRVLPPGAMAAVIVRFKTRLNVLLAGSNTKITNLQMEIVNAAQHFLVLANGGAGGGASGASGASGSGSGGVGGGIGGVAAGGSTSIPGLPPKAMLAKLVDNAVSTSSPIYKMFQKRTLAAIKDKMRDLDVNGAGAGVGGGVGSGAAAASNNIPDQIRSGLGSGRRAPTAAKASVDKALRNEDPDMFLVATKLRTILRHALRVHGRLINELISAEASGASTGVE